MYIHLWQWTVSEGKWKSREQRKIREAEREAVGVPTEHFRRFSARFCHWRCLFVDIPSIAGDRCTTYVVSWLKLANKSSDVESPAS